MKSFVLLPVCVFPPVSDLGRALEKSETLSSTGCHHHTDKGIRTLPRTGQEHHPMTEEGQRHKARQLMCHPMTVCAEQTLLRRQGGEALPSGPVEDEGTVPGDLVLCSTLPGKANDIMPVLPPPHPREARGDRPDACRGTGGPWHRQWKTTRGFPSTSCYSWPGYRRRQRDGVGSSANFHSYQHEETAEARTLLSALYAALSLTKVLIMPGLRDSRLKVQLWLFINYS